MLCRIVSCHGSISCLRKWRYVLTACLRMWCPIMSLCLVMCHIIVSTYYLVPYQSISFRYVILCYNVSLTLLRVMLSCGVIRKNFNKKNVLELLQYSPLCTAS